MAKPWQLWLFANGASVVIGLATGWWDVSIRSTVVACAVSALVLSWMGVFTKETTHD